MSTLEMKTLELEREVSDLKERLERLEGQVHTLTKQSEPAAPPAPANGEGMSHTEIVTWLKARGMIAELPPELKERAARWRALSEEEKQAHIREMDSLVLDPTLSQIIIDNRR
jgi:hypothetical protein